MDYLTPEEQERLRQLEETDLSVKAIRLELDRVLASTVFGRMREETKAFLGFTVAMKLLDRSDAVKEMTIGLRIWKEKDFNPLLTSKVRTAATALRRKLAEYYRSEGEGDLLEIGLPRWGYLPQVRDRRMTIEVGPIGSLNLPDSQLFLCEAATEALVHQLRSEPRAQVQRVSRLIPDQSLARYGLTGHLERRNTNEIRITIWLLDCGAGHTMWDGSFTGQPEELFTLVHGATQEVLSVLSSHDSSTSRSPRAIAPRRPPSVARLRTNKRTVRKADIR